MMYVHMCLVPCDISGADDEQFFESRVDPVGEILKFHLIRVVESDVFE